MSSRFPGEAPFLLDSALGTELTRRGADTSPPLWSARPARDASALVLGVHEDEAAAGADVLTAATFRTHARNLIAAGAPAETARREADLLTRRAIDLAREGGRRGRRRSEEPARPVYVAGSLSPLEDCYRPDLAPDEPALGREQREQADRLAASGADLIVVETMNSRREALAAAKAAVGTGLPVVVSFVTDGRGSLLSGDPLAEAAREVIARVGPLTAIGVNCVPARLVAGELRRIRRALPVQPLGAWGNAGLPIDEAAGLFSDPITPSDYARLAAGWLSLGAVVVGGCCGTSSAHTRAIRRLLGDLSKAGQGT